jgi:hypothetical protein
MSVTKRRRKHPEQHPAHLQQDFNQNTQRLGGFFHFMSRLCNHVWGLAKHINMTHICTMGANRLYLLLNITVIATKLRVNWKIHSIFNKGL